MTKPKAEQEEKLSEDEMARQKLGGVKGHRDGTSAPLTKQEQQQTLPNDDPGHVA